LLPEVDALYGVPQPVAAHPELDTGVHVALALDYAATKGFRASRCAMPCSRTISAKAKRRPKHGRRITRMKREASGSRVGYRRAQGADRVSGMPRESRPAGMAPFNRAPELRPSTLLDLSHRDRRPAAPGTARHAARACEADAMSRPGAAGATYLPAQIIAQRSTPFVACAWPRSRGQAEKKQGHGDAIAAAIRCGAARGIAANGVGTPHVRAG